MSNFLGADMMQLQSYNNLTASITVTSKNKDLDELLLFGSVSENEVIQYAEMMKESDVDVVEVFESGDICSILWAELKLMVFNNIKIKKCGNCENYFVITGRSDTEFCDRIAKTYDDGTERTCKEVGPIKRYTNKPDKDPVLELYRKAYKTRHARMVSKKMTAGAFSQWKEAALEKIIQVKDKKITLEEFEEWINCN